MLLRGSNNRGARGQTPNRSRGSRGRGSTSRGASNSSSKFQNNSYIPSGPQALRDSSNIYQNGYRGKNYDPKYKTSYKNINSGFNRAGTPSSPHLPNPFDQERLENSAKREQRGQNGVLTNGRGGRGGPRGTFNNKQVRFSDPPVEQNGFDGPSSPAPSNPFASTNATSTPPFGSPVPAPFNPFAATTKSDAPVNPFGSSNDSTSMTNPFSTPSQPSAASVFGAPSGLRSSNGPSNTFGTPAISVFGAPSIPPSFNPFSAPPKTTGTIGSPSTSKPGTFQSTTSSVGTPAGSPLSGLSTSTSSASATFHSPAPSNFTPNQNGSYSTPFESSNPKPQPQSNFIPVPQNASNPSSSALAKKLDQHLRKQGIHAPKWPTANPGDPKQKEAIKSFWQTPLKGYRSKVRESLIRAGYLDDPDKPKKLSEAIDFKGTCEDMCPEFEKFTRIVDHSVDSHEKDRGPDGLMWPSMGKMVKALARSAAGQDAPLPMDVRTPAALKRTLDYLLHTILGEDGNLPTVHGFLWDRTRAIRRDFVFQSAMNASELSDQIYCLERITRFHVIALHQMSREDFASEDFSEQQEVEQLGKSLLSLIHAYEDCNAQGIACENEAEFRAYYVLFNSHNTAILETVQDWGWKFWGASDDIRTAVSLVEALQNIWETRGPLKPYAATDIAHNSFSKFFSIVEDRKVSYTMACFAEIHFNNVRKSILKTILTSYRKQRDQTRDWTLSRLNSYLRFDDESDIISFGETYGLRFDEVDGEEYLSFDSEDAISDPFPPLKQRHSYNLVERKRGDHTLPEVIDVTVFEEGEEEEVEQDDDLFVKVDSAKADSQTIPKPTQIQEDKEDINNLPTALDPIIGDQPPAPQFFPKPMSIFDQVNAPKTFSPNFFTQTQAAKPPVQQSGSKLDSPSVFTAQPVKEAPSFLTPPTPSSKPQTPPAFVFSQPPSTQPTGASSQPLGSLGNHPIAQAPPEGLKSPFALSGNSVKRAPSAPTEKTPSERDESPKAPLGQSPLPKAFSVTSTLTQTSNASFASTPKPPAEEPKIIPSAAAPVETVVSHPPAFVAAKPTTPVDLEKQYSGFANWVALGDDGLIDQFTAYQVESILQKTVKRFMKEEAKRIAKEADELALKQADEFRYRSLATKYAHLWREAAHRLWLKKRGREARQARKEMAESLRASKAALSASVVEDFRASTSRRRDSLESLLDTAGALNGIHNANDQIRAIVNHPNKRQRSEKSTDSTQSTANRHKRGRSDNPLRRSLLSDPSYLNGGSRIHLMSNYSAQEECRRQVSGVQTDYFRLKARGIATLPDGTPLANSAAKNILHQKHSFDGITKPAAPKPTKMVPITGSVPAKPTTHGLPNPSAERNGDIQALKTRAKEIMAEDKKSWQKRSFEVDDEELFERAKRIREQMDEGAKWFRKEIDRETASRSVS